jgi:putative membrane-bound dehydrogenase-like protein
MLLADLALQSSALHPFERVTLSSEFLCEGASIGDLDGDGDPDIAAGPWWYEGPAFRARHAFYPAVPFDRQKYSDHFFSWILDVDGDGRNDVFVVGFPGLDAHWLKNPGATDGNWERFVVFAGVDNESPWFTDLTGDGRPELVCQHEDQLGWAEADWNDPRQPWTWHAALPSGAGGKFVHGLGVGDLNGDGRPDLLRKEGWYEQPATRAGDPAWKFHPVAFSPAYGGAQMLVHDFDGDGDADVFTAYAAHGYGLAWFEQRANGAFEAHELLSAEGSPENVSELHALCLADLDGDGLQDVVTGKRWWSHGRRGEAGSEDPIRTLGFLTRRTTDGVHFEKVVLHEECGVGVSVTASDVTGDGRCDVVVASKLGTYLLRQSGSFVLSGGINHVNGRAPAFDFERGTLSRWTATGDAFRGQPIIGDTVKSRRADMTSGHDGEYWIGGFEIVGDGATGTLTSDAFPAGAPYASFLIGGGASEGTRVEILLDAEERALFTVSGVDHETMQRVVVDLRAYAGQGLRIRLVDESDGGWGHLNFDDFRFHDELPSFSPPPGVRTAVPYAAVQEVGRAPADAALAMTVPPGFQVDLIAGEPDVHQPIALHVDLKGRLWVAEAYAYPVRDADDEARDSLVVFEDRDRDGAFEQRTVFHDRLNLVSGFITGHGGVWVGAAPHLWFIPDADDDLVPDGPPQLLLDGWGYQDTHETLNAFIWGPDGWLYGTHGVFTHSLVGPPGAPEEERVPLNAGVWRLHPKTLDFEVFAWGTSNPWGVDFDDHGEAFITACVIPHLWHMVPGGRYQRQGGRHFDAHPWLEIGSIADHAHYAGNIGDHAWWGRDRAVADTGTDAAGGGHAHCGALIYGGASFPAEYRNAILFHNIHGNRVNQDRMTRKGSSFVGAHAPDLVLANDPWYRGIALRGGPSGEVYFIDWYDRNACHRTRQEIWDRTNGRLYRLSYGGSKSVAVDLRALDEPELVLLQSHPDEFWARGARLVMQERGLSAGCGEALVAMMNGDPDEVVRLRALWSLHVGGRADEAVLTAAMTSDSEHLRAWGVRLATEPQQPSRNLLRQFVGMALEEESAIVQLALAGAAQRADPRVRHGVVKNLLARGQHADDANLPTVLWYAAESLVADYPREMLAAAQGSNFPVLTELLWRRFGAGTDAERGHLIEAAAAAPPAQAATMLAQLARALRDLPGTEPPPAWPAAKAALLGSRDPALREAAADVALAFGDADLAPLFRARLADAAAPAAKRAEALEGLARIRDPGAAPQVLTALADQDLQAAALRALAGWEVAGAPDAILANWEGFDAAERELAMAALTARPAYAQAFLESVIAGDASARLLDAAGVRRQIAALRDPRCDALLTRAWGRSLPPDANAEQEIARYKTLLSEEFLAGADPSRGRSLFARTCVACHTLWGVGGVLGPDITGSNRADLDYLLANLIDPSAEVGREYLLTTVYLKDGRVLGGTVVEENEQRMTLRTATGDVPLLLRDVRADAPDRPGIERSSVSLMPPGQLQALTDAEARDLIAYLRGTHQVPMAANPDTVPYFFDGVSLAGWEADPSVWSVEGGEIVGRAPQGLVRNSFAVAPLLLRDFRLRLQVRLPDDADNGGIQFRSEPLPDGEMRGYQADVGTGWWGKLYEESARGLLVDGAAGAGAVKPGQWNDYEIEARGTRVRLKLNGVVTADLDDPQGARAGVIGLQLHSGGPAEIRFRNFRIELLD